MVQVNAALHPKMSVEAAIIMTGRLRNTLGHNLAWPSTSMDKTKYNLAIQNVATACIHGISKLYR